MSIFVGRGEGWDDILIGHRDVDNNWHVFYKLTRARAMWLHRELTRALGLQHLPDELDEARARIRTLERSNRQMRALRKRGF